MQKCFGVSSLGGALRAIAGLAPVLLSSGLASASPGASVAWEGVEVAAAVEGETTDVPLSAGDAAGALESRTAAIASCFDGVTESMDSAFRVRLTVKGRSVTEATLLDASPAAPGCVEAALETAEIEGLDAEAAPVLITASLVVKKERAAAGAERSTELQPETGAAAPAAMSPASAAPPANQVTTSAAPASEEPKKPWKAIAQLTQSLGAGTFVKDDFAATPYYGYAFSLRGSYKLHDLLSLALRFDMDQQLTVTSRDSGTIPREFFFRDIRLSANSAGIYEDKEYTGIKLGLGFDTYIPVSKPSRAQEQVIAFRPRFDLSRSFEKLGPGTLDLTYTFGLKKNFAPATRGISRDEAASLVESCRQSNRADSGDCVTSFANLSHYFLNDFSVAYTFLDDFTATIGFSLFTNVSFRTNGSEVGVLAAGVDFDENEHNSNANPGAANVSALTVGTIELAYSVNPNIGVALGLTTSQNPFIQSGSNPSALRFPWWDFSSTADNLSTIYLDASFTY